VTYRVKLLPAAIKGFRQIAHQDRPRIRGALALLANDPRPPASRRLRGRDGFRVRVGDYRILYRIENEVLLVVVVTICHRRQVYER
jgi:mRNA interferase RelE/StbE